MEVKIQVPEEVIPDHLLENFVQNALELGIKEMAKRRALDLYKERGISLAKASRIAGIPLREMILYAKANGLYPGIDEEMINEEIN